MQYGLLGEHLPHSFSKEIHERIGGYSYELCEVAPENLDRFMTEHSFKAINVTIPYKQAVIPYLSGLSETAARIGAVNTIVNRNGKLYGDNTDFYGMRALIQKHGMDFTGKKVLILGTGGTSKTASAVAESLGAGVVLRVSRSGRENSMTYEDAYRLHADADFLINTTPCGTFPDIDSCAVDLSRFTALQGVVDVVYNPLTTKLAQEAGKRNIPAACGLYMLVGQAVKAYEVFMGRPAEPGICDTIFREIRNTRKNIVLTGMPGSGKSSVGRLLAKWLNRPFIDTDQLIVEKAGMEITDIFAAYGEERFREMETDAVLQAAARSGAVIATGGGVILKQKNVDLLKQNGTVYFLDRPLEDLVPTDDRPLASTAEAITKRYNERYGRYLETADVRIPVTGNVPETAQEIERRHLSE